MAQGENSRRSTSRGPAPARGRVAGLLAWAAAAALGGCADDSASPPAVAVQPALVQFATGDSSASFEIHNAGKGLLTWQLEDDAPWLALAPIEGSTEDRQSVSLSVATDSLPRGPHVATVAINSNGGSARVRVEMWRFLATQSESLSVATEAGTARLWIANDGPGSLAWRAGASDAWITVNPSAGTLQADPETLSLTIDRSGLQPGTATARVWVDAGAYGSDTVHVAAAVPGEVGVAGFVYYQGTRIPVADARVSVGEIADTTDTTGAYALPRVPVGEHVLVAEREGFTPARTAITVTPQGLTRNVSLASGTYTYRVEGRLANARDTGLVNAHVKLLNPDGSESSLATRTREGGTYSLPGVPPGARRLLFAALHYQDLVADVTVDGDRTYDANAVAKVLGPPEPVGGPVVARLDCARVRVSWTPRNLATLETVAGYRVQRGDAVTGPFADISGLVADAAAAHFDDGDFSGQRIYYRVLTETIDGDAGPPGPATGVTLLPWVELHPAAPTGHTPEERWGHSAVLDPGGGRARMLIIGGTGCVSGTCGIDFGDVWALDLTTLEWALLDGGTGPDLRNEHTSVLDEDRRRVIVFGGKLSEGERIYADTWSLDLDTNTWNRLDSGQGHAPTGRFGHTAVLDRAADRMLVYGGRGQAPGNLNDVWSFDLATHQWTQLRTGAAGETVPQPRGRFDHVAGFDPLARRMIVHGGLESLDSSLEDAWAFDADQGAWTRLPDGAQRCRHMMDYDPASHRLVTFGGWRYGGSGQSGSYYNDIQAFDLGTGQWVTLDPGSGEGLPEKRNRHSMVLLPENGALYVFGGLLELTGLGSDCWTFCTGER